MTTDLQLLDAGKLLHQANQEIGLRMVGHSRSIRHALAACAAGGHVLFEDIPGTGKTTLALALAEVAGLTFSRIQGTPDLMPSDISGTMVFLREASTFEFRRGPLFTQVLLFDEVNRATPRTQSALLEAMAERRVTVEGTTHLLPTPFFVVATANPLEMHGVFPLPEAQLDRFMVQLRLGYGSEDDEADMVRRIGLGESSPLKPVLSPKNLSAIQTAVHRVTVSEDVLTYIVRLCRASRDHELVTLGASPRAILALTTFSQALAIMSERDYVTPDDVIEAWFPVMRHRLRLRVQWQSGGGTADVDTILGEVLNTVVVPVESATEV